MAVKRLHLVRLGIVLSLSIAIAPGLRAGGTKFQGGSASPEPSRPVVGQDALKGAPDPVKAVPYIGTSLGAGTNLNPEGNPPSGPSKGPASLPRSEITDPARQPGQNPLVQPKPGDVIRTDDPAAEAAPRPAPVPQPAAGGVFNGPPRDPPLTALEDNARHFLNVLRRLGVPEDLVEALRAYLDAPARHPGDQAKVYHGRGHSYDVPNFLVILLNEIPLTEIDARERVVAVLSAAFHDIDPLRPEGTPPQVSGTLSYIASDPETVALLKRFADHLGIPLERLTARMSTRIKKTDFHPDAKVRARIEEDFNAMVLAESTDPKVREQIRRLSELLAFADKMAHYLKLDPGLIRQTVLNLADEFRMGISAGRLDPKTPIPTIEATYGFLTDYLVKSPYYALLPQGLKNRFEITLEFFRSQQPLPGPSAPLNEAARGRAPPKAPDRSLLDQAEAAARQLAGERASIEPYLADVRGAKDYIQGIMGRHQKPTEHQTEALLDLYMEEKGIDPDSQRGRILQGAMQTKFVEERDKLFLLDRRFNHFGSLILKLGREFNVTPAFIEELIKSNDLTGHLASSKSKPQIEGLLRRLLHRAQIEKAVSRYPHNAQGELLRQLAANIMTPSGKSVEEVSRTGAFIYAYFSGRTTLIRTRTGRDPDDSSADMVFYVVFNDGQFKIGGYRQNRLMGVRDSVLIEILKDWLISGGIPAEDFVE